MIQMQTRLNVADNSGARKIACIQPLGGDTGRTAGLGDVITASVKEATPDGTVKKGEVVKAVIVSKRQGDASFTKEIQHFAQERLSRHEYPRLVAFVENLPKTPAGKINRKKLREAEQGQT